MNMIMPKVNVRRQAAWARDHEDQNMTPFDSQVGEWLDVTSRMSRTAWHAASCS